MYSFFFFVVVFVVDLFSFCSTQSVRSLCAVAFAKETAAAAAAIPFAAASAVVVVVADVAAATTAMVSQ